VYLAINRCVTAEILSNFSRNYLRNRSISDIGVFVKSVYFNIRNNLPKSGTFLQGHPVYSDFGGLGVACWPLVPKFAGSNPAETVGFLRATKSPSFGGEVKDP